MRDFLDSINETGMMEIPAEHVSIYAILSYHFLWKNIISDFYTLRSKYVVISSSITGIFLSLTA